MAANDLHRLAGTIDHLRREASTGKCSLHADRPAIGFIEGWDLRPHGCCQECANYGNQHGYVVHTTLDVYRSET